MKNHIWKILVAFGLSLIMSSCGTKETEQAVGPREIKVVNVEKKDVPIYAYYVGEIFGEEDISINARVEGYLTGIHFNEGTRVTKGQLLYTIDPEPFRAAVAGEKSKVAEAQTNLANAENELQRYEPLAKIDAVSKSDLDFAKARRDASSASLDAAKASLRMAEINLSYTRIKSPITGFIGKTQARVGEFVGRTPNPVILNTVSRVDNVRVQFFLTESQYLALVREVRDRREDGGAKTDVTKISIKLVLSDGSIHPYKGKIDFVNREVDPKTGTILIQASFPNPDLILKPGQFGRVRVMMKMDGGALLVPQRSVSELQGQYSVLLVNDKNIVEARQIKIAETVGDYYIVNEGLSENDRIVIEGLQKVRSGIEVIPKMTKFESKAVIE